MCLKELSRVRRAALSGAWDAMKSRERMWVHVGAYTTGARLACMHLITWPPP